MTNKALPPWEEGFTLPETFNMASVLVDRQVEEGRGERIAVYYGEERITYRQLQALANRAGNALSSLGVGLEDRVMLLLHDCPEFLATYLGAMKLGAVPVPVNVLATPADLRYFLNDSRARVLVVSTDLLPKVEAVRPELCHLKHTVVVGETKGPYPSFAALVEQSSPSLATYPTHKDDASYWLYSSGTTGQAKAAIHLQHDMLYCVSTYVHHILNLTADDIIFSVPKLFFSYGLNNSLYVPFYRGASVVLYPHRAEPARVLEVIARYRPTLFFSVPTSYGQILREVEERGTPADLSSVRLCLSGGEPLPPALYERWKRRFGLEILDGIGSTEVGYIYISNRPGRVKLGSSGQLLPGYRAKIVAEEEKEVPPDKVGDLLIQGDAVAAGYWNKHERTKETFLGPWIRTGDRYRCDEESYYFYVGRSDDMLKVGGIWVSPIEVEQALLEHEAVAECAVVGALDDVGLVKPKAFVTLKGGYQAGPAMTATIQAFIKERLAPYKYPRWVEFVDELPKTATGKIQRFKLRQGLPR